ncbi:MAG: HEAT repeat domain-containing protein [Planctomycetota bacterium]|jgi:hypothetical protein
MKKLFLLTLAIPLLACGCASAGTFLKDRALDFIDIFPISTGLGFPGSASVSAFGVFHASAGGSLDIRAGKRGRRRGPFLEGVLGMPFTNLFLPLGAIESGDLHMFPVWLFSTGMSGGGGLDDKKSESRVGVAGINASIFGYGRNENDFSDPHYYDIRVTATAIISIDVGFSPVQFVDFVGGWFGYDPLEDDSATANRIERERLEEAGILDADDETLQEALLRNRDAWVRGKAAGMLGRPGNTEAVRALIWALENDEYPDVRISAAESLGIIGDEAAVEPLEHTHALDSDEDVRAAAAQALEKIRAREKEREEENR